MKKKRLIYLINNFEPLPTENEKKWRYGMLSDAITSEGHIAVRFKSDFDHFRKKKINVIEKKENKTRIFKTLGYNNNRSLKRELSHKLEGITLFLKLITGEKPNCILTSIPTIECTFAVFVYSKLKNIPFVVDFRDIWPDHYLKIVKGPFSIFINYYVKFLRKVVRYILLRSSNVTTISPSYKIWTRNFDASIKPYVFPIYYDFEFRDQFPFENPPRDPLRIIYAGSFSDSFDLNTVCECLEGYPNIKLDLVGDGPTFNFLKTKYKCVGNIRFYGWLNSVELTKLMAKSNYGLLPYFPTATMSLTNKFYEYISNDLILINSLGGDAHEIIAQNKLGYNYSGKNHLKQILRRIELEKEFKTLRKNIILYRNTLRKKALDSYRSFAKLLVY